MDFEPNTISEKFSRLIVKVFSCCEIFELKSKREEKYNEKWLKNFIEKIFSEMQNYF